MNNMESVFSCTKMVHMMWAYHRSILVSYTTILLLTSDWLTTSRCVSDGAVWQYFGSASFSLLHLKAKCYEGKLGLKKLKLGWKGRWADSLVMAILQRSVNIGINWVKLQQDKVWLLVSTSKLLPKNTVALLSWAQHFCQTCTKMSQKEATLANKIV